MGSDTYHEPFELLSDRTRNLHRGITTLIEELEAVDWYQQRADACTDDELRRVLVHNRNEEIEHAMMSLEWIRRNFPEFDDHMRTYLLQSGPITEIERAKKAREVGAPEPRGASRGSATSIGSLKANATAQAAPEKGPED
ncbi:MAG: ferritin-like domain-containing protein [Polyangiaceae bacterium]